MQDRIPIKIQIGTESFELTSDREEEFFLRRAEKFIGERLELHKAKNQVFKSDRVLAMIAIECMVTFLKGEKRDKELKETIEQKIVKMENITNSVLS